MAPWSTKLVLVGDGGVGKSTYAKAVLGHGFEPKYVPTLGVEGFPMWTQNTKKFTLWDTAGQEKFGGLRDGYYIGAEYVVVMFDLTNPLSFRNAEKWAAGVRAVVPDATIVLVGNKCDCKRKVSREAIDNRDWLVGAPYYEISVKSGVGLEVPLLV